MVERLTRIIELAIIRHGVDEADLEGTLLDAHAAIEAVRDGVTAEAIRAVYENLPDDVGVFDIEPIFQDVIDAVLTEKGGDE